MRPSERAERTRVGAALDRLAPGDHERRRALEAEVGYRREKEPDGPAYYSRD